MKNFATLLAGSALAAFALTAPAQAATFGFSNISGGDTVGDGLNSYFSFDVTDAGSGKVDFKVSNTVPGSSSSSGAAIKQVAFSVNEAIVGSLLSSIQVINSSGVDFESSTQNLSQTNNLGSAWFGEDFGGKTDGGNRNSVQSGEFVTFKFNANYSNVLAALNTGNLRLGIHVGSLAAGASDSYVNGVPTPPPTPAPEPLTIIGSLAALGLGATMRRRNQEA